MGCELSPQEPIAFTIGQRVALNASACAGHGIQGTCAINGNFYDVIWDYGNKKSVTGNQSNSLISPALLSESILTEAKRRFP